MYIIAFWYKFRSNKHLPFCSRTGNKFNIMRNWMKWMDKLVQIQITHYSNCLVVHILIQIRVILHGKHWMYTKVWSVSRRKNNSTCWCKCTTHTNRTVFFETEHKESYKESNKESIPTSKSILPNSPLSFIPAFGSSSRFELVLPTVSVE